MAEEKFLADINLNQNELLNPVFHSVSTDIPTPKEAQFWYNTTDGRAKLEAGGAVKVFAYTDDIVSGSFSVDLDENDPAVTRVFASGETTYEVTHNLNSQDLVVEVKEQSSGLSVQAEFLTASANIAQVAFNGDSTNNTYRLIVKK